MHIRTKRLLGLGALLTLGAVVVVFTAFASAASGSAQHARWDIISFNGDFSTPINPGGEASATAANGGGTITLTGTGTFVAPSSGGGSHAVTGGGNWTATAPYAGSGTYEVVELVSWEFANFQATTVPPADDRIGDVNEQRANGTAVLGIEFSDGQSGVLTVGCHGPGAPAGIFEGIAVTKGFKTYYTVSPPAPNVNANRTIFHVRS